MSPLVPNELDSFSFTIDNTNDARLSWLSPFPESDHMYFYHNKSTGPILHCWILDPSSPARVILQC
jgi:hypothetical protein